MVEVGILEDIEKCAAAAGFGAGGADHDPVDAGLDDGAGAHLAGLEGAVEGTALEPPVADLFAGLPDAGDLGVRQGRLIGVAAVIAAGDDLSFIDDHSADGDFADGDGFFRLFQGGLHIFDVFAGGGWYSLSGFIHNYWFHS